MSKTNLALTIPVPGECELVERAYPNRKPGYAIVETEIAPICLEGTRIFAEHDFEFHDDPFHLGHEGVGTIAEVDESANFKVGDRVVVYQGEHCGDCYACNHNLSPTYCDWNNPDIHGVGFTAMKGIQARNESESGGFAMERYRLAPITMLSKIPDEVSFKHAASLNCSFGVGFTNQERMNVKAGDTVLVGGIGFIAMGHIISALYRNATVVALIRNPYRIELLRKMGVQHIVDPSDDDWLGQVKALTFNGQGVDHAVDGSGVNYYQERLMSALRKYGTMNFSGHTPGGKIEFSPLHHILDPGHTFNGQHDVRVQDRERLMRSLTDPIVRRGIDAMVTHEFPVSQAAEAFAVQVSKQCGKIYIKFKE